MKKFISQFVLASFCILSTVSITYASSIKTVEEMMFEKLLQEQGVSPTSITSKNFSGNRPGEHIYLNNVYTAYTETLDKAVSRISSVVSYTHATDGSNVYLSKDEWRDVYINTNHSKIISSKLGIKDATIQNNMHELMQARLEREMEDIAFERELDDITGSLEIFADGDTSNSGNFDLLADYEIMELILLGKVEKNAYDAALEASGLPSLQSINLPPKEPELIAQVTASGSRMTEESATSTTNSSIKNAPTWKAPADQGYALDSREYNRETSAITYDPLGLNPEVCEVPTKVEDALQDYIANADETTLEKIDDIIPDKISNKSNDDSDSDDNRENDNSETKSSQNADRYMDPTNAKPFKWANEEMCLENKIFCLEIKFFKDGRECSWDTPPDDPNSCFSISFSGNSSEVAGGIAETDNCVSCHLHYIVANFDQLLAKTLTPSKVPGNLLESGKCKKSFLKVNPSLNFFAIKKPIPLPPEPDGLFQSSNPLETFKRDLSEGWLGNTDRTTQKRERYLKHVMDNAEGRSSTSIIAEVDEASVEYEREMQEEEELLLLSAELDTIANGYEDTSAQLDRLYSIIGASDSIIQEINSGTCEDLRSKKTCE